MPSRSIFDFRHSRFTGLISNSLLPDVETAENIGKSLSIVLYSKQYIILDFPRYSENVSDNIN